MSWLLEPELGLRLRRLDVEDVEAVVQLAERAFGSQEIASDIRRMLRIYCETGAYQVRLEIQPQTLLPVSYYLLVRDEPDRETRIGLSGLYRPLWAGKGVYWLGWFAVDPSFHGKGYGALLLETTLALAAAKGGRLLCVETSDALSSAMRLYRKMGFSKYGDIPDYWEPGANMVILARRLEGIHIPQGVPSDL